MTLSDRLAEAAARRDRPVPLREPVDEPVIDDAPVDSGLPAPCPDCGSPGYLEHIDLAARCQHERCRFCGCRWKRPF